MINNTKDLNFGQEVYFVVKIWAEKPPLTKHSEGVRKMLTQLQLVKGTVTSISINQVEIEYQYSKGYSKIWVNLDCVTTDPKECIDLVYQLGKTIVTKKC